MADTALATALQVQKWLRTYFAEYVRTSGFKPYMGKGTNSIIQVKHELTSGGKSINIPLITRLKAAGVVGTAALEGNEEALGNFNQNIAIDFLRNAVRINVPDQHYSEFDLLQAGRDMLTTWAADKLRTDVITAMGSIDGVAYGTATAGQRNTWTVNNADRVVFGRALANYNATHATALNNILAAQTMNAATVSLAKRVAKTADPHIRPMRVNDAQGREFFVMFVGSLTMRDLKNDATITAANREARPRDVDSNPIFQDGDLIYDGVIIREIPEIAGFNNTAGTVVRIEPYYLCGAQAVGLAWGQEPRSIKENFDYDMQMGIGTMEARGIQKMRFGTGSAGALKDHGMVTGYIAAPGDA
jgi:N4-gp56 family major capsid protein